MPAETIGSRFGSLPVLAADLRLPRHPVRAHVRAAAERVHDRLPRRRRVAAVGRGRRRHDRRRHRSNGELVAQGLANVGAALFGGLPATGAIARTATNVRAGARSPIAGMLHALFLLLFMLLLAPLMRYVPLAALAAVLLVVAWNMSELRAFPPHMSAPMGDRGVVADVLPDGVLRSDDRDRGRARGGRVPLHVPHGEVGRDGFEYFARRRRPRRLRPAGGTRSARAAAARASKPSRSPGRCSSASRTASTTCSTSFPKPPRVFILRMRLVPLIDACGVTALKPADRSLPTPRHERDSFGTA